MAAPAVPPMRLPKKGKRAFSKPPSKKANEEYGMKPRKKASDTTAQYDPGMGNRERGFIQTSPKKATGAMMGRPPPKIGKSKTITRSDSRKQFKPRGKKVF